SDGNYFLDFSFSMDVQVALLTVGCILLAMGLGAKSPRLSVGSKKPWLLLGFLTLLLMVAFALRVLWLDETVRVLVDEVNFSNAILRHHYAEVAHPGLLLQIDGINPYTWLYVYFQIQTVE